MKTIHVADHFCGAGGTSTGVAEACEELSLKVDLLAINHGPVAIDTHTKAHPWARHLCASLTHVKPRWSNVVVRRRQGKIADVLHLEGFGDLLLVRFSVVAAAHFYLGLSTANCFNRCIAVSWVHLGLTTGAEIRRFSANDCDDSRVFSVSERSVCHGQRQTYIGECVSYVRERYRGIRQFNHLHDRSCNFNRNMGFHCAKQAITAEGGMKTVHVADHFCGAGGTSTGVAEACEELGLKVDLLAINHWPVAIDTHTKAHPWARHLCASLTRVEPRIAVPGGRLHLLVASPECANHSIAKGGRPGDEQSRATAWDVLKWLQELCVDNLIIENVREFRKWGPWVWAITFKRIEAAGCRCMELVAHRYTALLPSRAQRVHLFTCSFIAWREISNAYTFELRFPSLSTACKPLSSGLDAACTASTAVLIERSRSAMNIGHLPGIAKHSTTSGAFLFLGRAGIFAMLFPFAIAFSESSPGEESLRSLDGLHVCWFVVRTDGAVSSVLCDRSLKGFDFSLLAMNRIVSLHQLAAQMFKFGAVQSVHDFLPRGRFTARVRVRFQRCGEEAIPQTLGEENEHTTNIIEAVHDFSSAGKEKAKTQRASCGRKLYKGLRK